MNKQFYERYGAWALITGASSGLGEEFSKQLAELGMNLVLVARRKQRLDSLAEQLSSQYGIGTMVMDLDLSSPHFMEQLTPLVDELEIGLVILNAGFSLTGEFIQQDIQKHEQLLNVNCYAPLQLSHAFAQQMAKRGRGGIIFVSSAVSFAPSPYWTHYAATKAYSRLLGEGLAYELKHKGIDVLTLSPGGMKTEFQSIAGIDATGAMSVKPVAKSALRNLGKKSMVVPGLTCGSCFTTCRRCCRADCGLR